MGRPQRPQGDPRQEGWSSCLGARAGQGAGSRPREGPGLPEFYLTLPLWHHAHLSRGGDPILSGHQAVLGPSPGAGPDCRPELDLPVPRAWLPCMALGGHFLQPLVTVPLSPPLGLGHLKFPWPVGSTICPTLSSEARISLSASSSLQPASSAQLCCEVFEGRGSCLFTFHSFIYPGGTCHIPALCWVLGLYKNESIMPLQLVHTAE